MAEILTQPVSTDSEGHTNYSTVFKGLFVKVELPKSINSNLFLRNDEYDKNLFLKSFINNLEKDFLRIQMDSPEFEKIFDVYSSNNIITTQILTSDIMQLLYQFYIDMNIKYELTITNNIMYIRFHCGKIFEALPVEKFSLDKEVFYKYYKILNFVFDLTYAIIKTILETPI